MTTRYLVDDLNPTGYLQVLEEVVGGAVQTRYTYGTSIVSQTRNVSSTPATSYYGYDAHGNITFLTDAGGRRHDSYDYDAWGILVASTGKTPNTRLYAGEEFDPDVGLINLRARQYKPRTGRFVTVDPLDAVHLTTCAVGSTPSRSSSFMVSTCSRIFDSSPAMRSTSSSVSRSRASFATWST